MTVPKPKACCRDDANLSAPEPYEGATDLSFRRCAVCGARHFTLIAEAGRLGLKFS